MLDRRTFWVTVFLLILAIPNARVTNAQHARRGIRLRKHGRTPRAVR